MKTLAVGSVLAIASTAMADVTLNFNSLAANGFQFFSVAQVGGVTGTLSGVSVNAVLDSSVSFTYADDLCIYLTPTDTLAAGGRLQVGGFSNLGATDRYFWANGGSNVPGTTVVDTVDVSGLNIDGASFAFWLGNGYGFTGTSGVWTGSITLHGVNAVPAPGALALVAAAAGFGRRRRA